MAGPDAAALPLTGERTMPGVWHENYWFRRHEAAYAWCTGQVHGRLVEVGCGEGYGTDLLARHVDTAIGLDYDRPTMRHAGRRYPRASFVAANLARLPVASHAVDVVATLQVIEHVWDHGQFVAECARILSGDGRLIVTTPNRLTFSPGSDAPVNPFHTHEFTVEELMALLAAHGFVAEFAGGLHAGARLADLDGAHAGSFVQAQLAAPADEWSPQLRRDVTSVTTADFEIRTDDPDASLDLVVVVRRHGEYPTRDRERQRQTDSQAGAGKHEPQT